MKIALISAMIFLAFFFLIILTRMFFFFALNQAYKNYKKLKKNLPAVLKPKEKFVAKEEDELRRKREIPRAHSAVKAEGKNQSQGSYEIIPSADQEENRQEMSKVEIVDFVKPIGFWTSMILGQKLTYLIQSAQTLNKRGNKGFWVSMIEAKDRSAGRQHGRN